MFLYLNRKFGFLSNQPPLVALSFVAPAQLGIYPALMTHKGMSFCVKAAVFLSAAATISRVLCIVLCIGATLPLYSVSLFGY